MKVTIQKFQELNAIMKTEFGDYEKGIAYVATLHDCEVDEVEEMARKKPKKFGRTCAEISKTFVKIYGARDGKAVKYFRANGQKYRVHYEPKNEPHNAGRYVEVATFSRDPINNLHKILASMVTPVRWSWFRWVPVKDPKRFTHARISLDFLEVEISKGYDAFVFFCQISNGSTRNFPGYFPTTTTTNPAEADYFDGSFPSISVGYIRRRWLPKWSE
jgi:hypothetical protein